MKKGQIAVALGLVIVFGGWTFSLFFCGITTNNDISYYPSKNKEMREYMQKMMPNLSTLGDYEAISFEEKSTDNIFVGHAETLTVKYDLTNYLKAKENVERTYSFYKRPVRLADSEFQYQIPAVRFQINDFNFRVVDNDVNVAADLDGLIISIIAMSDQKCTIVYMAAINMDMTYIDGESTPNAQAMKDFIGYEFDFNPFWEK